MAVCSLVHKWTVRYMMFVLIVIVTNLVEPMAGKVKQSGQRKQEIEIRLKQLNKQALKSIESSNGEIIDCIYITKQPAFDHPLLQNHTIQMKPSSYPHEVLIEDDVSAPNKDQKQPKNIAQVWHLKGDCPENTIPIKRITKEDLLRVDNIRNYGKKFSHLNISQPQQLYHPKDIQGSNGHEYALAYNNGVFRGARAQINVWKPRVQEPDEFSISQIWVVGGKFDSTLNSVESGSHVSPSLYGDYNPRLFAYWTKDGYQKTGCYNLICSGFVQTSKKISLGAMIEPISTYNGPQFRITLQIWKDIKTGNWWLQFNDNELVGYWPKELFTTLSNAANLIEWGGEIVNTKKNGQHTTTEMGSGHFPNEGFKKSSDFVGLKIIDMSNTLQDPVGVQTAVTQPTCYDIKILNAKQPIGVYFYFGGPGRNANCP